MAGMPSFPSPFSRGGQRHCERVEEGAAAFEGFASAPGYGPGSTAVPGYRPQFTAALLLTGVKARSAKLSNSNV
jgi:hypothetical protein